MRQFLAVPLPAEVQGEVAAWIERATRTASGWRWVPASDVHLTLRFLGEVDAATDLAAREAWRHAAAEHEAFTYCVEGIGVFPERGRPRILWAGAAEREPGGRLRALADRLERAACAIGFAPEPRAFQSHLTLARAARARRVSGPSGGGLSTAFEVRVEAVSLFRSELGPTGARYTCLDQFSLAGPR